MIIISLSFELLQVNAGQKQKRGLWVLVMSPLRWQEVSLTVQYMKKAPNAITRNSAGLAARTTWNKDGK